MGEKFFLLEHEEHGDMAACVAVNEQGKLVAEELWNGFDERFSGSSAEILLKMEYAEKEDVVSEIIERLCRCRTTAHRTIRMCLSTMSRSAMPKKMTRWIYTSILSAEQRVQAGNP